MTYTSPTGKVYEGADMAERIATDLAAHPGETWPIPPPLLGRVRTHLRHRIKWPPKGTPRHVLERWQRHADHLHNQDPDLPRLVDGVWITPADGHAVSNEALIASEIAAAEEIGDADYADFLRGFFNGDAPPSMTARPFPCCPIPEEPPCSDPT